ncbi:MAG: hypothetical protein PW843_07895 [Azospirillaceae bacterium]|nr:hypothetical protein [Azospirillaceae bacterium]
MQVVLCIGLGIVIGLVCGRIVNGRPGLFTVEALLGAIGAVMGAFLFGGLGIPASAPVLFHTLLFAAFGAVAAMTTLYAILIGVYWVSTLLHDYDRAMPDDLIEPPKPLIIGQCRAPLPPAPAATVTTPLGGAMGAPVAARQMETTIGI